MSLQVTHTLSKAFPEIVESEDILRVRIFEFISVVLNDGNGGLNPREFTESHGIKNMRKVLLKDTFSLEGNAVISPFS